MNKQVKKGGSVASDAVTSLVNQDTYSHMNKQFTNQYGDKQCGGKQKCRRCKVCGGKIKSSLKKGGASIQDILKPASNAASSFANTVVGSVKSTSNMLTNSATHALGLTSPQKSNYVNSGVFTSQPAAAYNSVLPRNVGLVRSENAKVNSSKIVNSEKVSPLKATFTNSGPSTSLNAVLKDNQNSAIQSIASKQLVLQNANVASSVSGGKGKSKKPKKQQKKKPSKKLTGGNLTLAKLMARDNENVQGVYSIRNKRGGTNTTAVGLDYSSIESSGSVKGPTVDRAMEPIVLNIASTQPTNTFPALDKYANWGSPLDDTMNFKYSGDRISVPPPASTPASTTGGAAAKKNSKKIKEKETVKKM